MRGSLLSTFSLFCVLLFSGSLFFSGNLMMFWLFLELGSLSLVPCFFYRHSKMTMGGLFTYIIVSGVASALIISGLLFEGSMLFSYMGMMVKFALFPFCGWAYLVLASSNWVVIWALSIVLKSSFLLFCFFLSGGMSVTLVQVCCFLTFSVVVFLYWILTPDWIYFWCHVMLSSTAALVAMSVEVSIDLLMGLFLVYAVWGSGVIYLLSRFQGLKFKFSAGGICFLLILLLVSYPGSVSLFYKLLMGMSMYSCSWWVFLSWVGCCISEQFFLVQLMILGGKSGFEWEDEDSV
uniref:NADH dehydrogenase subunit 2 n=1 Tax=Metagonimus yokogawai TaxID=84529 RepID=V9ND97_9TREM|nr:NADH dehydrogenase subunit 2 [Metagonimus yokogawai]AGN12761.1 NADH dehydrogenase subunit 2 [Metagonimus yokogawai]